MTMMTEQVKIRLEGGMMPVRMSDNAACYDVRCPVDYVVRMGRQVIDLCFVMELPVGWHADIRPRSGFSAKGFECERRLTWKVGDNVSTERDIVRIDADVALGTIDSDYRGHVGVIMRCRENLYKNVPYSKDMTLVGVEYVILQGTRIAQMLIARDDAVELVETDDIDMDNDRGGGFGHSGAI